MTRAGSVIMLKGASHAKRAFVVVVGALDVGIL